MQLCVLEFIHNVCGLTDADSTEFDEKTKNPIFVLLKEWFDYQKLPAPLFTPISSFLSQITTTSENDLYALHRASQVLSYASSDVRK